MAGEEMNASEEIIVDDSEMNGTENPNEPDARPLSETGYQVNPDGSVGKPGEAWDKE